MRVLITGATGFVGAATGRALAAAGHEPVAAPREVDAALLRQIRPDAILDCAGLTQGTDPAALMQANCHRPARLLAAAEAEGTRRVVLIGSAAAYAPMRVEQSAIAEDHPLAPISAYGLSKAALHRLGAAAAARGRIGVAVAVPFNILGPGQPVRQAPQAFIAQLRTRPAALRIGDLSAERDWVDIRDIARALLLLAAPEAPSGAFNLASGRAHATGELLDRLCAMTGLAPERLVDGEVRSRPTLSRSLGDAGRIATLLGWRPQIGLDQSLRDMLAEA